MKYIPETYKSNHLLTDYSISAAQKLFIVKVKISILTKSLLELHGLTFQSRFVVQVQC